MSDHSLRTAERRWLATGSPEAQRAYLRALDRGGKWLPCPRWWPGVRYLYVVVDYGALPGRSVVALRAGNNAWFSDVDTAPGSVEAWLNSSTLGRYLPHSDGGETIADK